MASARPRKATALGRAFRGKQGHVVLDQIRTVDRDRLTRRVGTLPPGVVGQCLMILQEMFAP
ncbi:MAG: type II toxin-antitoxin system PemK/MazF family toxin [Deltaproteobacteria bacterium]|nr:type II toxin-antitoxin system PemK/MazF family toxin [Deltaproteobacteria bacterium]